MSELNDRMMGTPDLNEERINKLKELFPDLFTSEGKPDPDEIIKLVNPGSVRETEKFEFKWFGKSEAKRTAFTPSKATLTFDEERSVNPDAANGNMIIEGENLEVMKCLLKSYREKVTFIYIDPPYNTDGDYIYNDKWDEERESYWKHIGVTNNGVIIDTNSESGGRFHSNWLNLMFPRLLLSRQLLADNGIIFISIDDNEVTHLRKLCDEVFGIINFVAQFPWRKRTTKSDVPYGVSQDYEWIICYAKESFQAGLVHERKYYYSDDYPGNGWRLSDITTQRTSEERPNCAFNMKNPRNGEIFSFNPNRVWGVSKNTFDEYYKKGKIVFPGDYDFLNISIPAYRVFESEDKEKALKKFGSEDSVKTISTHFPAKVGMNEDGNREIEALFGERLFSFPKPISLIKYLLEITNNKDGIILDFFSGSGTTGQAVMELNRFDEGSRKFILVQIPEKLSNTVSEQKSAFGFCRKNGLAPVISNITIERNRRVIKKLEKEELEREPSLLDSGEEKETPGFRVYKLSKSNFPRVDFAPDPGKSEEENLALFDKYLEESENLLSLQLDSGSLLDEVLLKNGFMLDYTKTKENQYSKNTVYRVKDKYKECLITIDDSLEKDTVELVKELKDEVFICLNRALDSSKKWNLKHYLGDNVIII